MAAVTPLDISTSTKSETNGQSESSPTSKIAKLNYLEIVPSLSAFKFGRVLRDTQQRKLICVEGSIDGSSELALGAKSEPAILLAEKSPFDEACVKNLLTNHSDFKKEFVNDVYGSFTCTATSRETAGVKVTLIYPATEAHIQKYVDSPLTLVEETPKLYLEVTSKFVEERRKNLVWVHNILDHKSEVERIAVEDSDPNVGFVLIPDLKWDGKKETLYLVAIVLRRDIPSIRELTGEHLPLLENILKKGGNYIEEKYSVPISKLRIFFHYQPSYYHLHIHFTAVNYDAPGIFTEKAHLLSTVIFNLKLCPDYYKKAVLSFATREASDLYKLYKEAEYQFCVSEEKKQFE